jgi:succinyl-CoA synthetase beta subunit
MACFITLGVWFEFYLLIFVSIPAKIFSLKLVNKNYSFSGITKSQAEKVAEKLGLGGDKKARTVDMLFRLYDLFVKKDALLIEVNPYAEDTDGNCK